MSIKRLFTSSALLVASLGTLTITAPVFADNPDNNTTSLNQDLGSSSSSSTKQSSSTTSSSSEASSSSTTSYSSNTEASSSSAEPNKGEEKLPEAGSNDVAIGTAALLGAGLLTTAAVVLPKKKTE